MATRRGHATFISHFFLGWQNQLEKVCFQFREIGDRIAAKTSTECTLLTTCFTFLTDALARH